MTDAAVAVPEHGGTDLLLREDQTRFDDFQLAALEAMGVEEAPNADLALFFHQAKRTGLDPFSRQIYLIGRWDSSLGRKKWTIQTSIDGFRIYRDRIGGFAGQREEWCGPDGVWRDVWLEKEPPAAARVSVWKAGYVEPVIGVAVWAEYAPYKNGSPMALWAKLQSLMLAKCAEALALRKAFPHDLSGLYVAEEMDQARDDVVTLSAMPHREQAQAAAPAPASQANQGAPASPSAAAAPAAQAGAQGAASDPTSAASSGSGSVAPSGTSTAGQAAGPATTDGRGEPPADVVANWRRHVLSREYKGSQTSRDGGMRTAFQEVRKAGLLDFPIEPGGPTFRAKMVELSATLPEKPNEAGDVPTTPAGAPAQGWPTDQDGWAVAPEDQPL